MREKPKLLYIVEAMGGGVFTYIVDLANELVEDFDMYVAYAVRPQTPQDCILYFDKRIHLIKVENFARSISVDKDLKAFWEIKKIVKEVKPDIIHLHSSKAGAIGRWAFNGHKIPMFYTPHGYSFLMRDCSKVKRLIFKFIETISAKRFCTTISCSEGEHQETLKLTKRAMYVDNGINITDLDRQLKNVKKIVHPFTVFTLGRICYQKNPILFNQIANAMPEVRFLWIGDGELRKELTAPNIEITGWVERKSALMKSMNADVFMLTSLWEGLPISLLEAMYMRKACVVNNVIGNRDVIHNGKNGFVCNEEREFVDAIREIQESQAQTYVENAFQDVLCKYNTNVMAKKYAQIYGGGVQRNLIPAVHSLLMVYCVTGKAVA